jgi:hypothetical protein
VITGQVWDGLDRSDVWNANEVRLAGPASMAVSERLGERPAWGTDGTKLPVQLMA